MNTGESENSNSRSLSGDERRLLTAIFAGLDARTAQQLSGQLDGALVSGEQQLFLELVIDRSTQAANCEDGPLPVRAIVGHGEAISGEVIVWLKEGYLAAMEFAWVTDDPPARFPTSEELSI